MVKEMKDVFSGNKGFVFSSIENVKASEIDVLRKRMRRSGSKYLVVKNRLACRALEDAGIEGLSDTVREKKTLGIGVIEEDPVRVARLMMEFARECKGFEVSKGYFEGRLIEKDRIKELSELPGREQLIAMAIGMMNAPVANFVGVLSSILKSLLYALNALKEKKEGK